MTEYLHLLSMKTVVQQQQTKLEVQFWACLILSVLLAQQDGTLPMLLSISQALFAVATLWLRRVNRKTLAQIDWWEDQLREAAR